MANSGKTNHIPYAYIGVFLTSVSFTPRSHQARCCCFFHFCIFSDFYFIWADSLEIDGAARDDQRPGDLVTGAAEVGRAPGEGTRAGEGESAAQVGGAATYREAARPGNR